MLIEDLFDHAAGDWSGDFRLWFQPGDPAAASASRATITAELNERTLLLRYSWSFDADLHHGLALISRSKTGTLDMAWTETFGHPGASMHCTSSDDTARVLGHYGGGGQTWGWRTEFEMPTPDQLVIRAFNIEPTGAEALATEARYERVAPSA